MEINIKNKMTNGSLSGDMEQEKYLTRTGAFDQSKFYCEELIRHLRERGHCVAKDIKVGYRLTKEIYHYKSSTITLLFLRDDRLNLDVTSNKDLVNKVFDELANICLEGKNVNSRKTS